MLITRIKAALTASAPAQQSGRGAPVSRRPVWAGAAMIGLFVVLQALTLDYGTRINDLPFIRDYRVTGDVLRGSGLTRSQLMGEATGRPESLDLWMVRFKLYSIEADEVVNIIALARIKPAQLRFDPGIYQYGGAYLYPLGIWYFVASRLGLIHIAPFERLLEHPQWMDGVWISGRVFVLAAFAVSALLLLLAVMELAPPSIALACVAIYLFCPASIMYSQVIKPHWYAFLWVNAALLLLVRAIARAKFTLGAELALAVFVGLAVGSAPTFSLFAVLIEGGLVVMVLLRQARSVALLRVPFIAVVVFLLTNPYYLLDWSAVQNERLAQETWFHPALDPGALLAFVDNSLFSGFGIAFTLLLFAVALWHLIRGPTERRLLAGAALVPIFVMAIATANLADWSSTCRYISYVIPAALILLAAWPWPWRETAMTLCAALTIAQALPMKLAYFDENSASHSTRFAAAAWIDAHIPESDAICASTKTIVPFDVPPFRFDRHPINTLDCRWKVRTERNPRVAKVDPGFRIAARFTPRLSPQVFPLVWENINPQITVYQRAP
jgi:hypothetical protein